MSQPPATQSDTIAISFAEYRDEEIVGFLANDHRPFVSIASSSDDVPRSRIIGNPHFSQRSTQSQDDPIRSTRPSAIFRAGFSKLCEQRSDEPLDGRKVECFPENTSYGLPQSDTEANIGPNASGDPRKLVIRVARLGEQTPRQRPKTPEPSFGKSTRSVGDLIGRSRSAFGDKNSRAAKVLCDPLKNGGLRFAVLNNERIRECSGLSSSVILSLDDTLGKKSLERSTVSEEAASATIISFCDYSNRDLSNCNFSEEDEQISTVAESSNISPTGTETMETLSVTHSLLDRLKNVDEQLLKLIESWPTLPEHLKETISTLIDVSVK